MTMTRVLPSRSAYMTAEALPYVVSGEGAYLKDQEGKLYFDASGGSGSLIFGHGDARFADIIAEQTRRLTLFPSRLLALDVVEAYADRLVAVAPANIAQALCYSSGTDAVEAALKLAIQFHEIAGEGHRCKVIGRHGSYHGNSFFSLAAGGFVARRAPFEAALPAWPKAAAAYCSSCAYGEMPATCNVQCATSLEQVLETEGADSVAAVIVEPVVGAALSGAVPDPRYLAQIREICDRNGILLIADEVMTGFGRTGEMFASVHWDLQADIVVCGKAISAGYYPLSAVLASHGVVERFETTGRYIQSGHTNACNPVAAAVGLEVLDRLADGSIFANATEIGNRLRAELARALPCERIKNIRGIGLMTGFDIVGRCAKSLRASDLFQRAALRHGLLVYGSTGSPAGEDGDHALLLPPITIGKQDIEVIVAAMLASAQDMLLQSSSSPAKVKV